LSEEQAVSSRHRFSLWLDERAHPRRGVRSCVLALVCAAAPAFTAFAQQGDDPKPAAPTVEEAPKGDGAPSTAYDQVFAEDWFAKSRPTFEIHGYMRVRSELMVDFGLGRSDAPSQALWPRPASQDYDFVGGGGARNTVVQCGDDPLNPEACSASTQGGANLRLRVRPVLTISDNIRAFAEVDLFDNLVLGSTSEGYVNQDGSDGGYAVRQRGGYTPIGAFATTQWSPTAGINSLSDSIVVKRAWGEYISPLGTFRFGRMPNHWGLGMVYNGGDGFDQDWGSTVDRISFTTGIPSAEIYFTGMWDFADEGAVGGPFYGCRRKISTTEAPDAPECDAQSLNAARYDLGAKQYDLVQSDDVDQWGIAVVRKRAPERARLDLARGDVVFDFGGYGVYRNQTLASAAKIGANPREVAETFVRRGYETFTPDLWGDFRWDRLRIGMEAALVWGSIENTDTNGGSNFDNPNASGSDEDGFALRQFGFALEASYRAIEDRLRLGFDFGYATGDDDVEGINGFGPGSLSAENAPLGGLDAQLTQNRTYSSFRFHPDYQIDQILWRRIMTRVQSAYYLKPSVEYDFLRQADGQRAGGGFSAVWSRASEAVQTPGNASDLGVEIGAKVFYQGPAGTFDVEGQPKAGFFGQLDYAVLVPLQGLDYLPGESLPADVGLTPAHLLRLYLGVLY
jgi:uncharacterized protein (TIGR04551 family)